MALRSRANREGLDQHSSQSVAHLTTDPGVAFETQLGRPYITCMEIDYEIISTIIRDLPLIQKGQLKNVCAHVMV